MPCSITDSLSGLRYTTTLSFVGINYTRYYMVGLPASAEEIQQGIQYAQLFHNTRNIPRIFTGHRSIALYVDIVPHNSTNVR